MRLHDALKEAASQLPHPSVTVADLAALHGQATQGALLVLLAAPCLLPLPGVGTVLAWGIAASAVWMWRGDQTCQLPARVARLSLPTQAAVRVLHVLAWVYARAATLARVRLTGLTHAVHRHWMAAWVAAMAVLIFLPIPFGNVLPAVALVLLGLGLVFRDGLAVLAGLATGGVALGITAGLGVLAAGFLGP